MLDVFPSNYDRCHTTRANLAGAVRRILNPSPTPPSHTVPPTPTNYTNENEDPSGPAAGGSRKRKRNPTLAMFKTGHSSGRPIGLAYHLRYREAFCPPARAFFADGSAAASPVSAASVTVSGLSLLATGIAADPPPPPRAVCTDSPSAPLAEGCFRLPLGAGSHPSSSRATGGLGFWGSPATVLRPMPAAARFSCDSLESVVLAFCHTLSPESALSMNLRLAAVSTLRVRCSGGFPACFRRPKYPLCVQVGVVVGAGGTRVECMSFPDG